ncbi:MAG: hypothetical protein WBL20_11385 [Sphingobium sp.]|uniref:hypothetical protein n=1 Tax=Sphingobium sp. TaxID=1912891 RepID=UPI002E225490
MAAKLKVYCTPIGFHDAYVAAPSQKAALKAWGADANLFARGAAEEVTDPALMEEPLAKPGVVVKRARGSMSEHLASAEPPARPAKARSAAKTKAPAPPRPKRDALGDAERALTDWQVAQKDAIDRLEAERARIAAEIAKLRREGEREEARLEAAVAKARRAYDTALAAWRNG